MLEEGGEFAVRIFPVGLVLEQSGLSQSIWHSFLFCIVNSHISLSHTVQDKRVRGTFGEHHYRTGFVYSPFLLSIKALITPCLQWRHITHCLIAEKVALRCKWYHIWFHVSCLVHGLLVFVLFQVWDVGTLGNTLTQWVCHSRPQGSPLLRGLCYPPHSPFCCLHKWALVLCM